MSTADKDNEIDPISLQAPPLRHVPTFAQTLTVAGFVIKAFNRYEAYAVCRAMRRDRLDAEVQYLFALTDRDNYDTDTVEDLNREALREARVLVLIAKNSSSNVLDWNSFFGRLGGAVPSWRALSENYPADIRTLATNSLPAGYVGEAWFLFENAVADGFEFLLGRRVRRLGGARRGKDLPDSICLTPDQTVLVLDAKASASAYSVNKTDLRPLEDYVRRQRLSQQGQPPVGAALIVASAYKQTSADLLDECMRFQADTAAPLCLLTVDSLLAHIALVKSEPATRNGVHWRQVFCKPGLANVDRLKDEIRKNNLLQMNQDI